MKRTIIFIISWVFTLLANALTVESTSGTLSSAITSKGIKLEAVKSLSISGVIDKDDFYTMRDDMSALSTLDLSNVSIYENSYPSLELPESAFENNTSISEVILPSSINYIGKYAFSGCTNLSSIDIPNSITTIREGAFFNCIGLKTIEIPKLVTRIEDYAFKGCESLAAINVNNSNPICLWNSFEVFYNVDLTTCVLSVPKESKEYYSAEEVWKEFSNINDGSEGKRTVTNNIKIAVNKRQAIISGYSKGEYIRIYDLYGSIFYNKKTDMPVIVVDFSNHGIYLLEREAQTVKFLIKD